MREWVPSPLTTTLRLLDLAVERDPDRAFLDFSGDKLSYADFAAETNRIAHGLRSLGVARGDRVCVLLDNVMDMVLVWFGANKLGAVIVPINTAFKGDFLKHYLFDSGACAIVAEAAYLDRIVSLKAELPALNAIIYRGELPDGPRGASVLPISAIRSADASPLDVDIAPGDLMMICYTSGTTGPSKGCMLSHGYGCNSADQIRWSTDLRANDVYFTPCPLFHGGASVQGVLPALIAGATVSIAPRFSVSQFWPQVEASGATVLMLLSVMLPRIAQAPDNDAMIRCRGQVRTLIGAPIDADTKERWHRRFDVENVCVPAYGLTEVDLPTLIAAEEKAPIGSGGRRNVDFEVRIADDDGNECPLGTAGEILVRPRRSGIIFDGYWGRPEATLAVMKDLWFHTGDIGKFDEDGYFYFVDRKKDYLRRGGENISSFEIERSVESHPDVIEAAAHSVPSDETEDELKITVRIAPGSTLVEEDLHQWLSDRLPRFALPRYVEFREDFPRSATDRIQKQKLREEGVTAATWDSARSTVDA